MNVLVTGVAGFIGAAVAMRLLTRGDAVLGIDNLNDYYDVALKKSRLRRCESQAAFQFVQMDIADRETMAGLFRRHDIEVIVHLAAQAGVRHSIEDPYSYIDANLAGFGNILEGCRHAQVSHLVFASSSSVYGANGRLPFSEHHNVDHPVSLYGATKKANELMAHSYAHLYGLPCTGLRFFTVYGPWGRPDMALFRFTRGIIDGKPIPVFNRGKMVRDFTYVDDVVEGMIRIMDRPAQPDDHWQADSPDPATSRAPYRIFNIGNNRPEELMRYIEVLERSLGRKAKLDLLPMQPGDVQATMADTAMLHRETGFAPATSIEVGVARFVEWYKEYYSVN